MSALAFARVFTSIVVASTLLLGAACNIEPSSRPLPTSSAVTSDGLELATATPVANSDGPDMITPTPVAPTETPVLDAPGAPAADLLELKTQLEAAILNAGISGNYAIAVTDLQTGETISVNGDRAQLAGCVMNLFVILQIARDLESGLQAIEPANSLIAATTWSSNASTARDLYVLAGSGDAVEGVRRVDALIGLLGLDGIAIDHPPAFHAYSIGRDYNNWVTADAMNEALLAFWKGDILTPEWRDFVLEHLSNVKPGLNYLTASVPEGIVSHKNGFLPADTGYVDNDAGIVRLQRGGREYAYAVTFLAEEVPYKYADVPLGQKLSLLTYNVMAARYP